MNLIDYVTYLSSGRIQISGRAEEDSISEINVDNYSVLQGEGRAVSEYVDITMNPPEIKPRLPFPGTQNKTTILANGLDEWIVSGLPVGSKVLCRNDGVESVVNDGTYEFSVDLIGTYSFSIDPFPYLAEEISIEAIT